MSDIIEFVTGLLILFFGGGILYVLHEATTNGNPAKAASLFSDIAVPIVTLVVFGLLILSFIAAASNR